MIDIEKTAKEVLNEYKEGKHPKGIDYECFNRFITDEHIKTFQKGDCPFCEGKLKDKEIWHCGFGSGKIPNGSSVGNYQCTGTLINGEDCLFGLGYVCAGKNKYLVPNEKVDFLFNTQEFINLVNLFTGDNIKINEPKIIRESMQKYFSDISSSFRWII